MSILKHSRVFSSLRLVYSRSSNIEHDGGLCTRSLKQRRPITWSAGPFSDDASATRSREVFMQIAELRTALELAAETPASIRFMVSGDGPAVRGDGFRHCHMRI